LVVVAAVGLMELVALVAEGLHLIKLDQQQPQEIMELQTLAVVVVVDEMVVLELLLFVMPMLQQLPR
jgi:hypothetical protein